SAAFAYGCEDCDWLICPLLEPLSVIAAIDPIDYCLVSRNGDLRRKRGAAFPELGGLLEGVGELQDAEVVAVAADDLDADRKPFGGEAGGHGDRRVAGDGDVVAALHPIEVVVHANAGDFARPFLVDREGRKLVDGAQKEVVALQEP